MVGCSHETSAADVVGRLRMPAIMVDACLAELRAQGVPAVLLSTCHRTELYWWGEDDLSPAAGIQTEACPAVQVNAAAPSVSVSIRSSGWPVRSR